MKNFPTIIVLAVVATGQFGCAGHTTPTGPPRQLTAKQQRFDAVWQASRDVLKKYYFQIDREDRRAGVIVTRPMTGKYFGEFWRRDAATDADLAESTVQTIYRQAKVTLKPVGPDAADYQVVVEVRTSRSDKPHAQITNVADAFDMFKLPGSSNRRQPLLDSGQGNDVIDLGRDKDLEQKIAADIRSAAGRVSPRS